MYLSYNSDLSMFAYVGTHIARKAQSLICSQNFDKNCLVSIVMVTKYKLFGTLKLFILFTKSLVSLIYD